MTTGIKPYWNVTLATLRTDESLFFASGLSLAIAFGVSDG